MEKNSFLYCSLSGGIFLNNKKESGVFIIESNHFEDEETGIYEGKILTEILKLIGVKVKYYYIRSKDELRVLIKEFEESDFKYLHLSCHGDENGIELTLDNSEVSFLELNDMFSYELPTRRLFLSCCSVLKGERIKQDLFDTKFLSITGPLEDIYFQDAAVFWSSFYHLMFNNNKKNMRSNELKGTVEKLSEVFSLDLASLILNKSHTSYNRYKFTPKIKQKS
jgi:hypothetical protein